MRGQRAWRWGLPAAAAASAVGVGTARSRRVPADLSGQVALVTGGSAGLGLALARDLAAEGCALALCARDGDTLAEAAEELRGSGATVFAQPCDVGDRTAVERLVSDASAELGPIDVLVNNAGVIDIGEVGSREHHVFESMMDVMFWGVVNTTLAVLPSMRDRRRGRIATVTSVGGRVSAPHLVPYSCAKHAAFAFSQGMRAELAEEGIDVTTVVPGLMRTGSHRAVTVRGADRREYAWFALGGASGATSSDPSQASRKIVDGLRRGQALVTVGFDAWVATRLEGLAPGTVSRALSAASRLLPDTGEGHGRARGWELESAVTRSPATAHGRAAAADLQRHRDEVSEAAPDEEPSG